MRSAGGTERKMDGNRIWAGESYIAGVSDTFGAKPHRHPLLEIYASCDGDSHIVTEQGEVRGEIVVIGPNAVHAISDRGKTGIALFLDPLTDPGYSLWRNTAGRQSVCTVTADESLKERLRRFSGGGAASEVEFEEELRLVCTSLLLQLRGETAERPFDASVLRAIGLTAEEDCDFEMDSLAKKVCLSKSRLAHVFSEQTGITLKEYLQYKRLERACRKMLAGESITEAAADTGFAGSSHIASSSIRLTGMQLRKMLNL